MILRPEVVLKEREECWREFYDSDIKDEKIKQLEGFKFLEPENEYSPIRIFKLLEALA